LARTGLDRACTGHDRQAASRPTSIGDWNGSARPAPDDLHGALEAELLLPRRHLRIRFFTVGSELHEIKEIDAREAVFEAGVLKGGRPSWAA